MSAMEKTIDDDDVTKNWPVKQVDLPDLDLFDLSLGELELDSPIEVASGMGKPTCFEWADDNYCELIYARNGLELDYEDGKLCYMAFFIGDDEFVPDITELQYAELVVHNYDKKTLFNNKTTKAELIDFLGRPISEDYDSDETILIFDFDGTCMECELNLDGMLKRINIYR